MRKNSYNVQLTYDISDAEEQYAEDAIEAFNYMLVSLDRFSKHLDKMLVPFKDAADVPPQQVWTAHSTFESYCDEAKNNLNRIQRHAFNCVQIMKHFTSDTQVDKLMKSLNLSIDDVTKQFERFKRLFNKIQDPAFIKNAVSAIAAIQKEVAQLKQIIEERIQKYIEIDILDKSWVDQIDDQDLELEEKVPFERELLDAQKDKLAK